MYVFSFLILIFLISLSYEFLLEPSLDSLISFLPLFIFGIILLLNFIFKKENLFFYIGTYFFAIYSALLLVTVLSLVVLNLYESAEFLLLFFVLWIPIYFISLILITLSLFVRNK